MRVVEKHLFNIDELSASSQEHAYNNWLENALDYEWYDFVYDDAKTIGELIGFNIDKIYFSGFYSQGDGACFEGTFRYKKDGLKKVKCHAPQDEELQRIAKEWQELQKRHFYAILGRVCHSGYYCHSNSTVFDFEDSRHNYGLVNNTFEESDFEQVIRDFMDWIYKQLEKEHDYLTSKESFLDHCRTNDYEFTADGKIFFD